MRRVDLFWSDPLGGSGNDYDVFVLEVCRCLSFGFEAHDQRRIVLYVENLDRNYAPDGRVQNEEDNDTAAGLHLRACAQP